MRADRIALRLAAVAVASVGAVALWGFVVDPDPAFRWVLMASWLPALWAFLEAAQERGSDPEVGRRIMTMHRFTIAWIGLALAVQVGVKLAVHEHMLSAELAPLGRRIGGLMLGTGLIVFGNHLPTLRSPWSTRTQPFDWQRVHRFAGWALVLGGVGICLLWLALPVAAAARATGQLLALVMILAVGRKAVSVVARLVAPPPARP
ncbi:MAG: hypothetical protein R3195_18880 [Gemmatimonadota bacterium]|nr:hypothetical protein [Gemmatimonadota bacterium]